MPPRRSARVAAAEEVRTSALAPLPLALAHRVFSLLPADSRGQAACVCRGWRAVLADAAPWTRLDLSERSGVAAALRARGEALLRGAAARAHGQLCALDVSGVDVPPQALLEVLAANARSLRELYIGHVPREGAHELPSFDDLAEAAPSLVLLDATTLTCTRELAQRVMRPAPPLAPLRLRALGVHFGRGNGDSDAEEDEDEADERRASASLSRVRPFAALLADATLQPTLWSVRFIAADLQRPAVLDALVDAMLARRLPHLSLLGCTPPAAAPLARLLRGGTLTGLVCLCTDAPGPLFDATDAALMAGALRESTTLTELRLCSANLSRDARAADTLLRALVGHPSLRMLKLSCECPVDPVALGATLAALVAADAPVLQELDVAFLALGDAGLAPLVAALPHNRHLRVLNVATTRMTEAFARERLLPAVRANTALRKLKAVDLSNVPSAALEAEQLVERRTALHDS
jgi:hypothetical protein